MTASVLRGISSLRPCARANQEECYDITAQFSHLTAGSHIAPHFGWGRVSLMLPLIAPAGCCQLQVGPHAARELIEGRVLCFDDGWEHQAWADADRLVLIVDVYRRSTQLATQGLTRRREAEAAE